MKQQVTIAVKLRKRFVVDGPVRIDDLRAEVASLDLGAEWELVHSEMTGEPYSGQRGDDPVKQVDCRLCGGDCTGEA